MADSEYSMNIYKSVKINIGTVMKNPEILKLKKCVKMQLKKLHFLIRYVSDQYNIQQMCAKAILENGGTLSLFLTAIKINNCMIKLLTIILMH